MNFKPLLAPNKQPDLDELNYPLLTSYKLDGIRCIFYKGQILSRSLKPIPNKQLREKFEPIRAYTEKYDLILDGEIYSPDLTFQEITSFVMTQDFEDKKAIKKFGEIKKIPYHLKFYCFDAVEKNNLSQFYADRILNNVIPLIYTDIIKLIEIVTQDIVKSKQEVELYFEKALKEGYEGLILRNPESRYKCGRATLKENIIYKLKPYRTFDAKIIDVIQATIVNPNAEKKINELGRSVTSKKKDDRILIDKASAFLVKYCNKCNGTGKIYHECHSQNGQPKGYGTYFSCNSCKEVKPVITMTDEEKEEIWKNKESYIGRCIEYKGMLVGSKDVPRHPTMLRFREDKD